MVAIWRTRKDSNSCPKFVLSGGFLFEINPQFPRKAKSVPAVKPER
jgi:hypothetical protein